MHYLYKITNIANQKIYIGQTIAKDKRWKSHKYLAKYPEKSGQYIHRTMAKYGIESFVYEIIASCKTQEDANAAEALLIIQYDSRNPKIGYNIKPGGDAWDEEMRKYISQKIIQHYQDHPEDRARVSAQVKILWQ